MELYILIAIAAAPVGVFAFANWSRRRHLQRLKEELADWRRRRSYWGVRVIAGKGKSGCHAARDLQGRILPIGGAPPLPLARCGRGSCRCRYQPYPERRREQRRHSGIRRDSIRFMPVEKERREPHDRRKTNRLWEEVKH